MDTGRPQRGVQSEPAAGLHLLLPADGCAKFLSAELGRAFPTASHRLLEDGSIESDLRQVEVRDPAPLVFCRQLLPDLAVVTAPSIRTWAELVVQHAVERVPDQQPWRLHIEPNYGAGAAGRHRCQLVRAAVEELLQRRRRHLLRRLTATNEPFTRMDSLVQLLLTGPASGLLSIAVAPRPFAWRRLISAFPKGAIPIPSDKAAPSRAFAKLLEAEQRLGVAIGPDETCLDLGASPGSWSYVALNRGARVIAVDRAPLRADLMRHPRLLFHQGDAFAFVPEEPVDWLLCDVIAAPERSIDLALGFAERSLARRFVVTIKFKGEAGYSILDRLTSELARRCSDFFVTRLCANKNEVCAFGRIDSTNVRPRAPR